MGTEQQLESLVGNGYFISPTYKVRMKSLGMHEFDAGGSCVRYKPHFDENDRLSHFIRNNTFRTVPLRMGDDSREKMSGLFFGENGAFCEMYGAIIGIPSDIPREGMYEYHRIFIISYMPKSKNLPTEVRRVLESEGYSQVPEDFTITINRRNKSIQDYL